MKLLLCHTDYRVYWPARLRALRQFLAERSVEMRVVEIAGTGSPYAFAEASSGDRSNGWQILFPHEPVEAIHPRRASLAVFKALEAYSPDVVIAGPIAFPSGATAVRWARARNRAVIITDDARQSDVPRGHLVNWVKRRIYANIDALLLPAPSLVPDYESWGVARERIFFGVNAIDNEFFASRADRARQDGARVCREKGLPAKFVLGAGRQVPKKNWPRLLEAWRAFKRERPDSVLHLVLVGNGPERKKLEHAAGELGLVDFQFRDFISQEEIAELYGLARGLVLPSRRGETWGLVVNEAMASGLPVLVSRECGCAANLVEDGGNGWGFAPDSTAEMAACLGRLDALSDDDWVRMGRRSRAIIAEWGLARFCQGAWDAMLHSRNAPIARRGLVDGALLGLWNGRYRPS